MMTLAAINYAPAKDIRSYLLPTTNPSNATTGDWALVWGPAEIGSPGVTHYKAGQEADIPVERIFLFPFFNSPRSVIFR